MLPFSSLYPFPSYIPPFTFTAWFSWQQLDTIFIWIHLWHNKKVWGSFITSMYYFFAQCSSKHVNPLAMARNMVNLRIKAMKNVVMGRSYKAMDVIVTKHSLQVNLPAACALNSRDWVPAWDVWWRSYSLLCKYASKDLVFLYL